MQPPRSRPESPVCQKGQDLLHRLKADTRPVKRHMTAVTLGAPRGAGTVGMQTGVGWRLFHGRIYARIRIFWYRIPAGGSRPPLGWLHTPKNDRRDCGGSNRLPNSEFRLYQLKALPLTPPRSGPYLRFPPPGTRPFLRQRLDPRRG